MADVEPLPKRIKLKQSGSDWKRLSSIAPDTVDTSDIPEILREQFARAVARRGLKPFVSKVQLAIRADGDGLEWYRQIGPGYQTRMKLLRASMEADPKEIS